MIILQLVEEQSDQFSSLNNIFDRVKQHILVASRDRLQWSQTLRRAFGSEVNEDSVQDFVVKVEVLDGKILDGLAGAYAQFNAAAEERIYLNEQWLASAPVDLVLEVLLEEIGHAIDVRVNQGVDAPGDEGKRFAELILNLPAESEADNSSSDHFVRKIGDSNIRLEASQVKTEPPRGLIGSPAEFSDPISFFRAPTTHFNRNFLQYFPRLIDIDNNGRLDLFLGTNFDSSLWQEYYNQGLSYVHNPRIIRNITPPAESGYVRRMAGDYLGSAFRGLFISLVNNINYARQGVRYPEVNHRANHLMESGHLPLQGAVTLTDIDFDGDYDMFVQNKYGKSPVPVRYFENRGNKKKAEFAFVGQWSDSDPKASNQVFANPFNLQSNGGSSTFFVTPKGQYKRIFGDRDGNLFIQENMWSGKPVYFGKPEKLILGSPQGGFWGDVAPELVDLNGDGLVDLIVGCDRGRLNFFPNVGTNEHFEFHWKDRQINPFGIKTSNLPGGIQSFIYTDENGKKVVFQSTKSLWHSAPTFGDLDNDGDMDMILGHADAKFFYYRNDTKLVAPLTLINHSGREYPKAGDVLSFKLEFDRPVHVAADEDHLPSLTLDLGNGKTGIAQLRDRNNHRTNYLVFDYIVPDNTDTGKFIKLLKAPTDQEIQNWKVVGLNQQQALFRVANPGENGSFSKQKQLYIDTYISPVSTPRLLDEDDTGPSGNDGLTNKNKVKIVGTAEPNSTILLTSSLGEASSLRSKSDSTGQYLFDLTLKEGVNQFTPIIWDRASNKKELEPVNFRLDTTAVQVEKVYSKGEQKNYFAGEDIDIIVEFSEPVFVQGLPSLYLQTGIDSHNPAIYVGGDSTTELLFRYTVKDDDWIGKLDYSNTSALKFSDQSSFIQDAAGNHSSLQLPKDGTSQSLLGTSSLSLGDHTPPARPGKPLLQSDRDSGISDIDNITNNPILAFKGVAEPGAKVLLSINSSKASEISSDPKTGEWHYDFGDFKASHGIHRVSVSEVDQKGNQSESSDPLVVNVDLQAPQVRSVSSLSYSKQQHLGLGDQVRIVVGFDEPFLFDLQSSSPELLLDVGRSQPGSAEYYGHSNSFLYFRYSVQEGDYTELLDYSSAEALLLNGASISDIAGNKLITNPALPTPGSNGSLSTRWSKVLLDGSAPSIPNALEIDQAYDLGISNEDALTSSTQPKFKGIAEPESEVKFLLDGTSLSSSVTADSDGKWEFRPSTFALGSGRYELTAFSVDAAGNRSGYSEPLQFEIDSDPSKGTFPNTGIPSFSSRRYNSFGLKGYADLLNPEFVDLDSDGDFDVFSGSVEGDFYFSLNEGRGGYPVFASASENPFGLDQAPLARNSNPTFGDLDGDGDLDLLVGYSNKLRYFTNIGTAQKPSFELANISLFDINLPSTSTYYISPVLGDCDDDGDLDLLIGDADGKIYYFQNKGSRLAASFFDPQLVLTPALTSMSRLRFASPALGDIDHDGDLDLFIGDKNRDLWFLDNLNKQSTDNSNRAHPFARFPTASKNPYGFSQSDIFASPALADIDGDSDLDLLVGSNFRGFTYYENNASTVVPVTTQLKDSTYSIGAELIISLSFNDPVYIQAEDEMPALKLNIGDGRIAEYLSGSGTKNINFRYEVQAGDMSAALDLSSEAAFLDRGAALIDRAGNNVLQGLQLAKPGQPGSLSHHSTIVVDTNDYTPPEKPIIRRLTNQSDTGVSSSDLITSNRKPTFIGNAEPGGAVELLFDNQVIAVGEANQKGLWSVSPSKHEFSDGLHQIYARVTDASGNQSVLSNAFKITIDAVSPRGSALAEQDPRFEAKPASGLLFGIPNVGNAASPTTADFNNDGKDDLLVGNLDGKTLLFENLGSSSSPDYGSKEDQQNPQSPTLISKYKNSNVESAIGDLDLDGDLDLLVASYTGDFLFHRNKGTNTAPAFEAYKINPFGLSNSKWAPSVDLVDLDGDNDLDLFVGKQSSGDYEYSNFYFYENISSSKRPGDPKFAKPVVNPFGLTNVGYSVKPLFLDIDGDGDQDLLAATSHEDLKNFKTWSEYHFFRNIGTQSRPHFADPIRNPFGLDPARNYVDPAAIDLDGDLDLDLLVGEYGGSIEAFYNTAPIRPIIPVTPTTSKTSFFTGDRISFQLTFDKVVYVTSGKDGKKPSLSLQLQSTQPRQALYQSGSGTKTLTFAYVVQPGDYSLSLDFEAADALNLNGSAITDVAGNDAVLTLATPGDAGSLSHFANLAINAEFSDLDRDRIHDTSRERGYRLKAPLGQIISLKNEAGAVLSDSTDPTWQLKTARRHSHGGYQLLWGGLSSNLGKWKHQLAREDGTVTGDAIAFSNKQMIAAGWEDDLKLDLDGDNLIERRNGIYELKPQITLKNNKGSSYSDKSSSLWDAFSAVSTDNGFQVLLKGTGKQKGQYQLWNTNQKGVFKDSSGWKALDAAVSLNWEGVFGKDLNGDKVIGNRDSDGDGFVDDVSTYQIYDKGRSIQLKDKQGGSYSAKSSELWDIDATAIVGNGYQALLRGTGKQKGKYQLWNFNSNGVLSKKSDWKPLSAAIALNWEGVFGKDLNADKVIGNYDANGDGLVDNINTYQIYDQGESIQLKNKQGKAYSAKSSGLWDIAATVKAGSGYQALLRGTGQQKGKYQVWNFTGNGVVSKESGWKEINTAVNQTWEKVFNIDLNSDFVVGNSDLNFDGLVDDSKTYKIFDNYSAVPLTNPKSQPYSFSTSSLWDMVSAVKVSSGYQVLLQGTGAKLGSYQVWSANRKGKISEHSKWKTVAQSVANKWEKKFDFDINNNGFIDGATSYRLTKNPIAGGPSRVFSSSGGKPYTPQSSQVWNALAATSTATGFDVLIKGLKSNNGKFSVWSTHLNGRLKKQSGWKTLGYAMGENWESKFGVDLNSDKSIGNHDSNADGLVDNRSAYQAYDQGRSISLKTAQRKVLSAKSSGLWDIDATAKAGNGYQALLRGTGKQKGKYQLWTFNANGVLSKESGWKGRDVAVSLNWEGVFAKDLDSNNVIGNFDSNGDGLVDRLNTYQIYDKGRSIQLISKQGKTYSAKSSGSWDIAAAAKVGTDYQALLRGTGKQNGKYQVWSFDQKGVFIKATGFALPSQVVSLGWETRFKSDLNNNGLLEDHNQYQFVPRFSSADPAFTFKNKNGAALSPLSSQLWDAISGVTTDSGFDVLLEGAGTKKGSYQIWSADEQGVFKSSSGWKGLNAAVSLNWEGVFGKDLNGDKVIGNHDANADGLVDNVNTYQIYDQNQSVQLKNKQGKAYSAKSSGLWDIDVIVKADNGYQALLRGTGKQKEKYQLWDFNANGVLSRQSGWKARDAAVSLNWEGVFGKDLNGNKVIGNVDLNGDGLVDGLNTYQIYDKGRSIQLKSKQGKAYSAKSSGLWDVDATVKVAKGYQALLRGTGNQKGKYQLWNFNSNGVLSKQSSWKGGNAAAALNWEAVFAKDLNRDGVTGNFDRDSNGLVDGLTNYSLYRDGQAIALTNSNGAGYSDSSSQLWDVKAASALDKGFAVLVVGAGSKDGHFQEWTTDSLGSVSHRSGWKDVDSAVQAGWEVRYWFDLNGDHVINNFV